MSDSRRPQTLAQEIERIREIVARHTFPAFVKGFDVQLGEFDDEPAMWIIFHVTGPRPTDEAARRERVDALRTLREEVHNDLLAEIESRYPYYRYSDSGSLVPSVG